MSDPTNFFYANGHLASEVRDVTSDVTALDSSGFWTVVATYEGELTCIRWERRVEGPAPSGPWTGPDINSWRSSLNREQYMAGVEHVRARIAAGDMYQGNVCRVLTASLPDASAQDIAGLASLLRRGNPAPHAMTLRVPTWQIASASPELFLQRKGRTVVSSPIKGTGVTAADLTAKDEAENVMIVDLVRNDLSMVCQTGTVTVPHLLEVEQHPGLVHLVSTVQGQLRGAVTWDQIFAATFPPGSVTGAPKASAINILAHVETAPRGPYCGAIGWVDADRQLAELAVGIRTFWVSDGMLHFGTGAGITWASDAAKEWEETQLKAKRLISLASSHWNGE